MKNQVVNDLAAKSKGLKKVMQPRMAYKYAPRENSTSDLIAMQAQSTYAFSGRKASQVDRDQAMNLYNRRAKSIGFGNGNNGGPAAAPSSGQGIMFNDTSATQLKDQPTSQENEVVIIAQPTQPAPVAQAQQAETQQNATEEAEQ